MKETNTQNNLKDIKKENNDKINLQQDNSIIMFKFKKNRI